MSAEEVPGPDAPRGERESGHLEAGRANGARAPFPPPEALSGDDAEREMRRLSRRAFLAAGGAALGGFGLWHWVGSRPLEGGIPWPLRRMHEFNERLSRAYFDPSRLSPATPHAGTVLPRVNGVLGLESPFDLEGWTLNVFPLAGRDGGSPLRLTLDDIRRLPRAEVKTLLRCIEGWSDEVVWGGARLADFVAAWPVATRSGRRLDLNRRPGDLARYVALETPDCEYYVGLDMAGAMHPQTLLCYEMNGAPLATEHGAPLRLAIPVKYGIKSLKRIGTIRFTDERPRDYWAERGYDWYSGH